MHWWIAVRARVPAATRIRPAGECTRGRAGGRLYKVAIHDAGAGALARQRPPAGKPSRSVQIADQQSRDRQPETRDSNVPPPLPPQGTADYGLLVLTGYGTSERSPYGFGDGWERTCNRCSTE